MSFPISGPSNGTLPPIPQVATDQGSDLLFARDGGLSAKYVEDKYDNSSPAKVGDFLAKADCWIIAHAVAKRGTVVTRESKVDKTSQTPKVPNVCETFDVPFIQTFELLKLLKFKL